MWILGWALTDHEAYYAAIMKLIGFCGRYGNFVPPFSLDADLRYLQAYADAIGELIEEETRGLRR
jgi:hypothetical protein